MLHKSPKARRLTASVLLAVMLSNTIFPTVSYALTSGPTQPEATSFEPVDTTDMVNLQTGDLTYNIPLIEVPGPEGGYPLSLSYHAGIQPNEDASWVGLGWTLNPGAITRNVNGYPDDWFNPSNTVHSYWVGGQSKTYSIGVSVGIANIASVGVGLAFSQDTYRGFGVGYSASVSIGIGGSNSPLSASIGVGISAYGDAYAFGGIGLSFGGSANDNGLKTSIGLNFSTNFESIDVGVSAGVGFGIGGIKGARQSYGGSLLGASISTGGNKPSLSIGGLSASVNSSNVAQVQTKSNGFGIDIPVWYGVNISLGFNKTRYWMDEKQNVFTHGSLNSSGWSVSDDRAYDTYSLLNDPPDPHSRNNISIDNNPTVLQGGAYFDFDLYSVNAQGLGGNMRPYQFQGEAMGLNQKDNNNNYTVQYFSPKLTDYTPQFRFAGDFSNSYRQNYFDYSASDVNLNLKLKEPPFDNNFQYGNPSDPNDPNSFSNNQLAGSRHVDINLKVKPSNIKGYFKLDRYQSHMIEGFSITNESGVTYHFGLPAYAYGEEIYQGKIDQANGKSGNRQTKTTPYAYTWYLTTITGPDFVDRDNDGAAGDGDWGYWINLEYGKWSNKYAWRNPSEGYNKDEDNEWQNCSMGYKEIYYLNAIRTRSHLALFEKDIREDGKGASPYIFDKNTDNSINTDYKYPNGVFDKNSSQSLKLSKIYLMNTSDAGIVSTTSGLSSIYTPSGRSIPCTDCELASNILDKSDIDYAGRSIIESKAIRIIDFNYDYSLCQSTTNSYDINNSTVKNGKLTLLSILTRGKGGASILPPTRFEYELSNEDKNIQTGVNLSSTQFTTSNGSFNVGDLIMKDGTPNIFCGVITQKNIIGSNYTYTLFNSKYTGGAIISTIYKTKNPDFDKDLYDNWGYYKSDCQKNYLQDYESNVRRPTPISSNNVDAWSLCKIITQLGTSIKINYEGDIIDKSVIQNNYSYLANVSGFNATYNQVYLGTYTYGYPLNQLIENGTTGELFMAVRYVTSNLDDERVLFYGPLNFSVLSFDSYYNTITANLETAIQSSFVDAFNHRTYSYAGVQAGNIYFLNEKDYYGGGIRVKQIISTDNSEFVSTTNYDYNNPLNSLNSSGVTSLLPNTIPAYKKDNLSDYNKPIYRDFLYNGTGNIYALSRELPPPAVMYEYVTVTNEIKNADEPNSRQLEGKTEYQFEVFKENMVGRVEVSASQTGSSLGNNQYTRNLAIKKFTSSIGNIKRITRYDNAGHKITETINHYLHDGLESTSLADFFTQYKNRLAQFFYQGYIQERYTEVKQVSGQANSAYNGVKATMSAKEEYPCIPTGQTVINYVNGTRTTSENLAFDFYSGAVTKTVETDAYGNRIMTEVVPAWRKYTSLGLMVTNNSNKNMLTQTTGTYTYKVDGSNNKLGLVSACINTWNNGFSVIDKDGNSVVQNVNNITTGNIWRPQSTYNWMPDNKTTDGLTVMSDFPLSTTVNYSDPTTFNYNTNSPSDTRWKKTGDITMYDVYSKALEATDINSNYAATHMTYGSKKVELTGGPANYGEIGFSGAEDDAINQTGNAFIRKGDGIITTGIAHTGQKCLKLGVGGKKGFLYSWTGNGRLIPGRDYTYSVWVKPVSGTSADVVLYVNVNGNETFTSISSLDAGFKSAGGWKKVSLNVTMPSVPGSYAIEIGCKNNSGSIEAYVDDFRFQPLNATTTAYVYDPFSGELTYVLNNNNMYTRFEYDAVGRLLKTYKEKFNSATLTAGEFKTNEYQYNFSTYNSAYINNQSYTKNDCVYGTPTSVTISVSAGMFTSTISQEDADAQAQAYAQLQANAQAKCQITVAINVSNVSQYALITFKKGGTTVYSHNFYNGESILVPLEVGTYDTIEVRETDNISRRVDFTAAYNTSGVDVIYTNVSLTQNATLNVY